LDKLGSIARMIGAAMRHTSNPTMLTAGYKANVIPGEATATVDGRFLPGFEEEFFATIDGLLGDRVERESIVTNRAVETTFDGDLVTAMTSSLTEHDPDAAVVPFLMSGGTDAKDWTRLGIRCFGFSPLRLTDDLDFSAMFHGRDERVPLDALRFGTQVLDTFLDRA
jgi:acetylornithine deacetylase/succinyl-diaminopimelate desuccinylase-like protein